MSNPRTHHTGTNAHAVRPLTRRPRHTSTSARASPAACSRRPLAAFTTASAFSSVRLPFTMHTSGPRPPPPPRAPSCCCQECICGTSIPARVPVRVPSLPPPHPFSTRAGFRKHRGGFRFGCLLGGFKLPGPQACILSNAMWLHVAQISSILCQKFNCPPQFFKFENNGISCQNYSETTPFGNVSF